MRSKILLLASAFLLAGCVPLAHKEYRTDKWENRKRTTLPVPPKAELRANPNETMVRVISSAMDASDAEVKAAAEESRRKLEGKKVAVFDWNQAPILDVLRVFTELTDYNVVASQKVMDKHITLSLRNVTPQRALKTMCQLYNLWYSVEDNVIRIITLDEYTQELDIRRDEQTMIIPLKYASAMGIAEVLKDLLSGRIDYSDPEDVDTTYDFVVGGSSSGGGGDDDDDDDDDVSTPRVNVTKTGVESSAEAERIDDALFRGENVNVGKEQIQSTGGNVATMAVFNRNNTLMIRTVDKALMEQIREIVEAMDTPTRQVLLEVKILRVTLGDSFGSAFDVDWDGTGNLTGAGPVMTHDVTSVGTGLTSNTFSYNFYDNKINATLELLQSENRVKTVATPLIMCADNAPGSFFVGTERTIVTGYTYESREVGDQGDLVETTYPTLEQREIGHTVDISPRINADGTITMRINVDISSINLDGATYDVVTNDGDIQELSIDAVDTSTVESIIVAQNEMTLAIGGLVSEESSTVERKVPVLGDLPVVNFFFKNSTTTKTKTETIILITPHIMLSPGEGQTTSDRVARKLSDHPYVRYGDERIFYYNENDNKLRTVPEQDYKIPGTPPYRHDGATLERGYRRGVRETKEMSEPQSMLKPRGGYAAPEVRQQAAPAPVRVEQNRSEPVMLSRTSAPVIPVAPVVEKTEVKQTPVAVAAVEEKPVVKASSRTSYSPIMPLSSTTGPEIEESEVAEIELNRVASRPIQMRRDVFEVEESARAVPAVVKQVAEETVTVSDSTAVPVEKTVEDLFSAR